MPRTGGEEDIDGEANTRRDVDEEDATEEQGNTHGAGDPDGNVHIEEVACTPDLPEDAVDEEVRSRGRCPTRGQRPCHASMDGSTGRGLAYPSVANHLSTT